MMNKISSVVAAAVMLASFGLPAFAYYGRNSFTLPTINANVNYAHVTTDSMVLANSGNNSQGNTAQGTLVGGVTLRHYSFFPKTYVSGDNSMMTGDVTATSNTTVFANLNQTLPTVTSNTSTEHHHLGSTINANVNLALINTSSYVGANSGNNVQGNYSDTGAYYTNVSGNNSMTTGKVTATSNTDVVVNSQWTPSM